jgi:flagellar hook-associated protein 1 FlgK
MATSILGIGQSALAAAQAGLATTGHNIANASTPGYSRQVVVQGSSPGQDMGFGFVGKGTEVVAVKRIYSEFLTSQVRSSQTSKGQVDAYYAQISRLNNQFADEAAGISTVMQDFFKSVQTIASSLTPGPARQTALSSAQTLAARFQGLDQQLNEARANVASQMTSSIGNINMYSQQIAKLNDAIEKAMVSGDGRPPNDLLDQRDYAISELSKEIKATVVRQGNSVNVLVGNGQPLVSGAKSFQLTPTLSKSDPSRMTVGYITGNGVQIELPESTLTGGTLGGLLEFRNKTLDTTQNALGRIAIGLAATFNEQHKLGQDLDGNIGGDFFKAGTPSVISGPNSGNAELSASITDVNKLTTSDYRLDYLGGKYVLTRLSDQKVLDPDMTLPATYDGVQFGSPSGTMDDGDFFVIKPTVKGAGAFTVAISDPNKIAAAAPIRTEALTTNIGNGQISAGTVNGPPPVNVNLKTPVTITFADATHYQISGDPTVYAYTAGADISYNGWTVQISGAPAAGDNFKIGPNDNASGDNRNAVLLGALQTKNTLANGSVSYQGAYAQLVAQVGSKTHELEVTGKAEAKLLSQAVAAQQEESGVNLDEEAANLMRYQQAYQAAAKVMQTANQLFDLLLSLGGN